MYANNMLWSGEMEKTDFTSLGKAVVQSFVLNGQAWRHIISYILIDLTWHMGIFGLISFGFRTPGC